MSNILEDNTIKLRALEPADANLLYVWENDPEIWQAGETLVPFSYKSLQDYIANASLDIFESKQLRLMIDAKVDDTVITVGTIDLFDFNPQHQRVGVGILIYEEKYRRSGYASSALNLLIKYCFGILQIHTIYCNICSNNAASLNLFKKNGFKITGKKLEWSRIGDDRYDEYTLQLINK